MNKPSENWLKKANISWFLLLIVAATWTSVLMIFDRSEVMGDLKANISHPFDFRVRDLLGRSPQTHHKIKVFTTDDNTVGWLKSPDLDMIQWCKLIINMAKAKPAAIIIDKLFSIPNIPHGKEAELKDVLEQLENIKAPIYVGSYVSKTKIPNREPIKLDGKLFSYKHMLKQSDQREDLFFQIGNGEQQYIYGPGQLLQKAFKNVGHIMYNSDNRISLFYRVGQDTVLPYIMLLPWAQAGYFLGPEGFSVNQKLIPTDGEGRILVNIAHPNHYYRAARPLLENIKQSIKGAPPMGIEENDYVFIMPAYYTGNTDFKKTAMGVMPAGFVHLAALNSILNQDWLVQVLKGEFFLICGVAILGGVLAKSVGPLAFAVSIFLGSGLWVLLAIILFSYANIVTPWLLPLFAYIFTAMTVFIEKSRVAEKKSQFIRNCLDGVISAEAINSLAKKPELLSFSAREQVVTVMFIDVVGFSLIAENQLPRIAFDQLKFILGDITQIVHRYGGIVNKNLGDGLLCFFGYSLESSLTTSDHAEKALECAIEIQKGNLPRTLREFESGMPVFPLRIGINTSSVYLGNIGSEERIDLTIVGNGVNFAKRLEGACENHSVLMGVTTKELVNPMKRYKESLKLKYIEIKHHTDMVESWEFDPFFDQPELRLAAINAHKSSIARVREDERWELPGDSPIILRTNVGTGKVLNYSRKGMSIWIEIDIMIGTLLRIRLDDESGGLAEMVAKLGIDQLVTEVCWVIPFQGGFTYGIKYKDIDDFQLANLLGTIRQFTDTSHMQIDKKSG